MLLDLKYIIISYLDLDFILNYCKTDKLKTRLLLSYKSPTLTEAIKSDSLISIQYLLEKDDCLDVRDYELAREYPLIFDYLSKTYIVNQHVN
jgi:hypothetical protein